MRALQRAKKGENLGGEATLGERYQVKLLCKKILNTKHTLFRTFR